MNDVPRRDRLQIAQDILECCLTQSKVTRLLRLANLQYNAFGNHIGPLVREGLLDEIPMERKKDKRTYFEWRTTPDGLEFLRESRIFLRRIS